MNKSDQHDFIVYEPVKRAETDLSLAEELKENNNFSGLYNSGKLNK